MRKNSIERNTKETQISCSINLDGTGQTKISTGIGFFDHMLEIFSHHSLLDLKIDVKGDTHVDLHHTVEDTAYVIAQVIIKSLGNKKGWIKEKRSKQLAKWMWDDLQKNLFDKIKNNLKFISKKTIRDSISDILTEIEKGGLDPKASEFSNISKLTERVRAF